MIARGRIWEGVSAAAPGKKHRREDIPCQDASVLEVTPEGTAVAVLADGAGSAEAGGMGAARAVWIAMHALEDQDLERAWIEDGRAVACAREVVETVRRELGILADGRGHDVASLSCTLLALWATEGSHGALQVGDGFTVVRESGRDDYRLLLEPAKGEYVNQTVFVTSDRALDSLEVAASATPIDFGCVSSDGLEEVAIHMDDWTPGQRFFRYWEDFLDESDGLAEAEDGILQFLEGNEELDRRSIDDRSVVFLRRRAVSPAP